MGTTSTLSTTERTSTLSTTERPSNSPAMTSVPSTSQPSKTSSLTTTAPEETTPSSSSSQCLPIYKQCGGKAAENVHYDMSIGCCDSDYGQPMECHKVNDFFSQC